MVGQNAAALFADGDLTEACGTSPDTICELVFDITGSQTTAEIADVVIRPLKVIVILVLAWILVRIVKRLIDKATAQLVESQQEKAQSRIAVEDGGAEGKRLATLQARARRRTLFLASQAERGKQRAETLGAVLKSLAAAVIWTIALLMALGEFDINLGPLIASAGIVGIAIGFGAQTLVRDFLSGIFMLIEDQFGVGDIVDLGDAAGVVEAVNLRTTLLRDVHGTLWHIPNGEVRRVGNMSQQWARAVLDVEVAYDTDINHAMRVIKDAADEVWKANLENATVLEEPQIWGVERFGSDAIAIRLVLKVEPAEQWATAREVRRRLKDAFDEEGIEIPFPQRTVWMHDVTGSERNKPQAPSVVEVGDEPEFTPKGAPEGEA